MLSSLFILLLLRSSEAASQKRCLEVLLLEALQQQSGHSRTTTPAALETAKITALKKVFLEQYTEAKAELSFSLEALRLIEPIIVSTLEIGVKNDRISEMINPFSKKWFEGERQGEEFAPTLIQLFQKQIPRTKDELNTITRILYLKYGLAQYRLIYASELLKINEKVRTGEARRAELDKILQGILEDQKSKVEQKPFSKYSNILEEVITGRGVLIMDSKHREQRSYQIEQRLLESTNVPQILKDEIKLQRDFISSFPSQQHPFYHQLLDEMNRLFPEVNGWQPQRNR